MSARSVLLACLLLASGFAHAQDERHAFEITPLIGYRSGGDFDAEGGANPNIQASASFGLILGYAAANSDTRYELLYTRQQSEIESTGGFDLDVEHLHIGGTATFAGGELFVPFISGGLGASRLSPQSGDDVTRFSGSLALGTIANFSEHFRLRLEVRGYLVSMDGNAGLFCDASAAGGTCLVRAAGDTMFQYEFLAGLGFAF
jgi:hypothetical protein